MALTAILTRLYTTAYNRIHVDSEVNAQMKDSTKWAGTWGTRVSASGQNWSSGYISAGPSIFQRGAAAVGSWQTGVASAAAAQKFVKGLNAVNWAQTQATVQGAGQAKYTASGSTKQAKYAKFSSEAGPRWSSEISSLPPRGMRGSPQNQARMANWSQFLISTRGSY